MADDPTTGLTAEQLDLLKQLEEARARLLRQEAKLRSENKLTAEQSMEISKALANFNLQINELTKNMGPSERASRALKDAIKSVKEQFGLAGGPIVEMTQSIGQGLTNAMGKYGQIVAAVGSEQYRNFINPIGQSNAVASALGSHISGLNSAIENLRKTQTTARVAAMMFGEGLDEANEKASLYPQALRLAASATGITRDELDKMNQTMRIVPGATEQVKGGIAGIAETAKMTIQATAVLGTVSRAFGLSTQEAATMGAEAWKNFGQTTGQTIRQMGLMADAARQTGVDRRTAREQIQQASGSLAIFGQRTATAASTWTTFMTNLRGAGVPISEVGKIVDNVTQSIAGMSVQNRAFIGMMSGMSQGRTALGGALQLELAMRSPDGMQRNLEALTTTLGQFAGGKLITIEEAASNPQLEMQFQLQRQMLGKLTNITSAEQQNRVLETLQNVQRGGMSSVEGSKVLQEAYKQGENIQKQQLTALQRIENAMRARFGEAADRQLIDLDDALTGLKTVGKEIGGLRTTEAMFGRVGTQSNVSVGKLPESKMAMDSLGRQVRNFFEARDTLQGRRGIGGGGGEIMSAISSLRGDDHPPNIVTRRPRTPAQEAISASVPDVIGAPTIQHRGVVPDVIQPRENHLMTELLNTVKRDGLSGRTMVPDPLFAKASSTVAGETQAGSPTVTMDKAGTTSTIIVKITDEGRTDVSKKIHDDILAEVNKSALGISY